MLFASDVVYAIKPGARVAFPPLNYGWITEQRLMNINKVFVAI